MEKLLSYNSFDTYFESLLKQTRQMDKIKVLRISDQNKLGLPLSDTLCAQASVQSKYLNEIFFTSEFGNQDTHFETLESVYSDCRNYPVNIKYLRLDWILYTEEGFSFLRYEHSMRVERTHSSKHLPSRWSLITYMKGSDSLFLGGCSRFTCFSYSASISWRISTRRPSWKWVGLVGSLPKLTALT